MTQHTRTLTEKIGGDWSITGIVQQAKPLVELSNGYHETARSINIDCGGIKIIDLSGFQLLYVWMQCLHLRGFRAELINIPDFMQEAQKGLGFAPPQDLQEPCSWQTTTQ